MATSKNQSTKAVNYSATANFESFVCLWLDQSVDSTEDNRKTHQELRKVINYLRTFNDRNQCEQYIRQIKQEKVVLIVSGSLGRQVVPRLHDLPQFSACYVFCQDKKANEQWTNKYHKVIGVFAERAKLIAQISKDQVSRAKMEDGASIAVISSGSQSLQARNATFMWFQLFIEVLLRMHHKSSDRKALLNICKDSYQGNYEEMEVIEEFEKNYKPENAIWWYTHESCFYRMMNKALRIQDFNILFVFRFFITDIAKQLKKEYEKFIRTSDTRNVIRVYRGQLIGIDELELMKNNIGEFISMNSFLSTSRNLSAALYFARLTPITGDYRRIVYQIEIDPRLQTNAFADISRISFLENEDELLIMLGALYYIKKVVEDKNERVWMAYVSLASEDDYDLKETFSYMKKTIGDDTDLDSLAKILLQMGESEKAYHCYKRMLCDSKLAIGKAELGLGMASFELKEDNESLEHFEKALQIRQTVLGEDHEDVGECYSYIGMVHNILQNNYDQAMFNLMRAVKIQERTLPPVSLTLSETYQRIAHVFRRIKKHDLSLEYYNKALKIRQAMLPECHPDIASSYGNLGKIYEIEQKYSKALKYYERSLDIRRMTLPPTHEAIAISEENICKVKDMIEDLSDFE